MRRPRSIRTALCLVLLLAGGAAGAAAQRSVAPPPRLNGLETSLEVEKRSFLMGSRIDLVVSLRFDPAQSEASTLHLDMRAGSWRFEFHSVDTTFTYYRDAVDTGTLAAERGRDQVRLSIGWNVRFSRSVHLLSPDGEQIPPGRYDLYAVYLNTTPGESRASLPGEEAWWNGEIAAGPARVAVRPAKPEQVLVDVPRSIVVERDGDRMLWRWNTENPRAVAVTRRPGYALGVRTHGLVRVSGEDTDTGWRGTQTADFSPTAHQYLPDTVAGRALSGEPLQVTVDIEIFESSVPPQHLWRPERGDYRVLWRGEAGGAYR